VPTLLVPPWGLFYDIKKDVPPGPSYPQVPPWGLVYDIKKDVFPPDPAYTGASVRKVLCILPSVWLVIGMCKPLSIGA